MTTKLSAFVDENFDGETNPVEAFGAAASGSSSFAGENLGSDWSKQRYTPPRGHTRRSSGSRSDGFSDCRMLLHTARKSRSSTGAKTAGRSSMQRGEPFASPYRSRLGGTILWTAERSGWVLATWLAGITHPANVGASGWLDSGGGRRPGSSKWEAPCLCLRVVCHWFGVPSGWRP